ncbi:MAG: P-loop NTPase [Gammaproteobacteria bacterium]|nr:MAG: P-loop NTPase [Gammaproteobacteria bacterium]
MFEQKNCSVTPIDQASSLRNLNATNEVNVLAVTGGKGGVGKTNIAINLAVALADLQRKVMLLDADLGLSNVDVMLGLRARKNLYHVLQNECCIEDIIIPGPHGIQIIPAASGVSEMANLSVQEHMGIIDSISELNPSLDYFIIDTAPGIGNSVSLLTHLANSIIIVVCDEPASLADAYALIKVLSKKGVKKKFQIISNMVESSAHGERLFSQLEKVSNHFLEASLEYCGYIPIDKYVRKAIKKQQSVIDAYPTSRSSLGFARIARELNSKPKGINASGAIELFLERQLSNQ